MLVEVVLLRRPKGLLAPLMPFAQSHRLSICSALLYSDTELVPGSAL
jgi:hypothetical protein